MSLHAYHLVRMTRYRSVRMRANSMAFCLQFRKNQVISWLPFHKFHFYLIAVKNPRSPP